MSFDTTTASFGSTDIITLLDLDRADIDSIDTSFENGTLYIDLLLQKRLHQCPICSSETDKIKGYTTKKITHSILNNAPCIIRYRARRYVCDCGKTFYEDNPFTQRGSKISAATVYNVLQDLRDPTATFTSIGKRYNISPTTVAKIFDKSVNIPRRALPECLCFDETYAFKSEKSNYICVLLDYTNKKLVDVLPSRRMEALKKYFYSIPIEERKLVKYVSFDMWETYRTLAKELFPNCITIVDKFHVLQELGRKVTSVRIEVMKRYGKRYNELKKKSEQLKNEGKQLPPDEQDEMYHADKNYYLLKKFNWLLFKNDEKYFDPDAERKYNKKLNRLCNFHDIYNMILSIDKDLKKTVDLKEMVHNFYRNTKYEEAKTTLNELIKKFQNSEIPQMIAFSKTLIKWKREIINSFIKIESINKKMNNALIENRNKTIKLLKHSSNGYLNWERFRNRILYTLNNDTNFKL